MVVAGGSAIFISDGSLEIRGDSTADASTRSRVDSGIAAVTEAILFIGTYGLGNGIVNSTGLASLLMRGPCSVRGDVQHRLVPNKATEVLCCDVFLGEFEALRRQEM